MDRFVWIVESKDRQVHHSQSFKAFIILRTQASELSSVGKDTSELLEQNLVPALGEH